MKAATDPTDLPHAQSDPGAPATAAPVLRARNLTIALGSGAAAVPLVEDVSFDLKPGRTLCIVGESGSGKTMVALSLMRLLPPGVSIAAGSVQFEDRDLLRLDPEEMRRLRGSRIGMIFQEPMTSLNPAFTIGDQIAEAVLVHRRMPRADAEAEAVALLRKVNIPSPEQRMRAYPHQLSGGMRQRVVIAMALVNRPSAIIADEPTTALDVTVQAQIMELLHGLREELGSGVLLITHDLGVVRDVADEVIVLYAGKTMEIGSAEDLFGDPQHPYTIGLLGAVPRGAVGGMLSVIPGMVPSANAMPPGCRFSTRCQIATERCRQEQPPLRAFSATHSAACWLAPIETRQAA